MPTRYVNDKFQTLPDFVAQHGHEVPATEQASICKILAKYNGHYPNRPLLGGECLAIPDDLEQQLKRNTPRVNGIGPRFTPQESQVLNKLLQQYNGELSSMFRNTAALRSPKRGMRVLRNRQRSIDLTNIEDVQRLKRFLKIARVSALGAIVIDATFAGQKVNNARDAGENAEKVAYEEYGALIGEIALASLAIAGIVLFAGPGLILLTVVGGVSALLGAEGGREFGKALYEQISAYEVALPAERKKQLLSEMQ